ncbi:hypothetical protein N7491_011028 [Penicillium cf. griseofulvum]|uniref:Uncharacterized protein n=1 Tax=Penicillium cf. griseofulvum TaxID=2972120 RepID=A0A9W9N1V6_9EURO|nr:hypothetical protein N7472_001347 [Penicillium cf. griseofulvum]KAJ5422583.1 hypothetical protein N7491_011028 [Penicillium cf. griseofulvum]KAJ5428760.1 hypothetical protein N7445_010214 [Penicillium cf. griseofulvum]
MLTYTLFTIFVALPVVHAGGWDDFANNLATDLAPFLSLFGEQITKQYLSESINVVDYFIFAMAPMGILTGVVSAIRVCGTPSLRAFIGRAQEGAGNAEAELCTSTSRDVCELYNSGGIARVFGRPKILEVVHDPDHDFSDPQDDTAGIYTFQQYLERDNGKALWRKETPSNRIALWKNKVMALWRTKTVVEKKPDPESAPESHVSHTPFTTFAPNLSLNIGIKKQSKYVFYAIALLGLVLQVGVLAFAGFATYYLKWGNGNKSPESYACPLVIIGTVLVCGGMFHCAFLIGQSTEEDVWRRQENVSDKSSMYWIQPGSQIIGDQTFDAFSYTDCDNKLKKYITSKRKNVSNESKLGVWAAIGATTSGFVLQFTGLRARAMQRLKPKDNCFATFPDEVIGHELDWLALRIGRDLFGKATKNLDSMFKIKSFNLASPDDQDRTRLAALTDLSTSSTAPAREFKSEMVEVRTESRQIAALIEATIKTVLSKAKIKKKWETASSMFWGIDCALGKQTNQSPIHKTPAIYMEFARKTHTIYLEIAQDFAAPGSPWVLKNKRELEGILGLWVWSLKSDLRIETKDPWTDFIRSTASDIGARRIISTDQVMEPDLEIWLGDDMKTITKSSIYSISTDLCDASAVWTMRTNSGAMTVYLYSQRVPGLQLTQPTLRFFGWKNANLSQSLDSEGLNIWSAPMTGSLVRSCAQEIFASFLTSILHIVDDFGPVHIIEEAELIRLENSLVSEIVAIFTDMRLGSKLEALLCVMPLMLPQLKIPPAASALAAARKSANQHRKRKDWKKAENVLQWAWGICKRPRHSGTREIDEDKDHRPGSEETLAEQSIIALCELYRDADLADMETGCLKTALLFVTHKAGDTNTEQEGEALCLAAKHKWVEVAIALLELGAQPDCRDTKGRTPLSHAAESGSITIVENLMNWGSFPNSEDDGERTPLSYASGAGCYEVVELLLGDVRVPPDQRDFQQRTPFLWAAENGHGTVVKRLLETGKIEPDRQDQFERTPLLYAAANGHDTVVKQLLETGKVKPDRKDKFEQTPLSYAAVKGYNTVVKQLLETGKVEPDRKDKSERTPLSNAAKNGHDAVVKLLLETGQVNPDAMDLDGKTPPQYAMKYGYTSIVDLIKESKNNGLEC